MTRIPKPCITCGRIALGSRCPEHQRANNRRKTQGKYTSNERDRMRQAVTAWIAKHGQVCVGYRRTAHHALDLTADHLIPVSEGGEGGPLRVLCATCNKRRGGELAAGRDRERRAQVF
jgi:5-methylcytosine-specific restriction endonuclease McrA